MHAKPVVAIGGIGGSGTRVGAWLLRRLGTFIGSDLNGELDNLWFTLLFKRLSILTEADADFAALTRAFADRMQGRLQADQELRVRLIELARASRMKITVDVLGGLVETFLAEDPIARESAAWGWKEPNAHVVVERMMPLLPNLRYIHFERRPLYMVQSANQTQLKLWGPAFLDRAGEPGPREALAYWCAVHRRMKQIQLRWSERVVVVRYDDIIATPDRFAAMLCDLSQMPLEQDVLEEFRAFVAQGARGGDGAATPLESFNSEDLAYISALGYACCNRMDTVSATFTGES